MLNTAADGGKPSSPPGLKIQGTLEFRGVLRDQILYLSSKQNQIKMANQIFRYSGYLLLITFILLCFMPQADGPTNLMPPATYLMTNISALALIATCISGIILLLRKFNKPEKPTTF